MQSGRTAEDLLDRAVRAQFFRPAQATPPSDEALLAEYHALTDLQFAGRMTDAQAVRLKAVETEPNDRDEVRCFRPSAISPRREAQQGDDFRRSPNVPHLADYRDYRDAYLRPDFQHRCACCLTHEFLFSRRRRRGD